MVMGAGLMIPPSLSPMTVMKSPMPTPMALFRLSGMESITASRKPVTTSSKIRRPSMKITDIPTCQGTLACWKPMTEKVSTAFIPMPEARARGRLAKAPISTLITAAPRAVAVTAPAKGTPAADRIPGFTKMI